MEMLRPPQYNPVGQTQGWVFWPLEQSSADINFFELQALHATDINLAVSDLPTRSAKDGMPALALISAWHISHCKLGNWQT